MEKNVTRLDSTAAVDKETLRKLMHVEDIVRDIIGSQIGERIISLWYNDERFHGYKVLDKTPIEGGNHLVIRYFDKGLRKLKEMECNLLEKPSFEPWETYPV